MKYNKIIICQGLPASGKSTWSKKWVEEDPTHRIRINCDDIRKMLGPYWVQEREVLVWDVYSDTLRSAIDKNYDIVIDNVNLHKGRNDNVLRYVNFVNKTYDYKYKVEFKTFFDVSVKECIERDANRDNPVGKDVIIDFYNRYKHLYKLKYE